MQEYELWRERYAGKLTALEESFAGAMVDRDRRRRRLRRGAVAAAFVVLAVVAGAIGVSRQQVATSRDEARAEALRAEASKLLALAQTRLDEDPTEALAYTTSSLELTDTPEARVLALLGAGRSAAVLRSALGPVPQPGTRPSVRTDGGSPWAGTESSCRSGVTTPASRGFWPVTVPTRRGVSGQPGCRIGRRSPGGLNDVGGEVHAWSFPGGEKVRTIDIGAPAMWHAESLRTSPRRDRGAGPRRGVRRPSGCAPGISPMGSPRRLATSIWVASGIPSGVVSSHRGVGG